MRHELCLFLSCVLNKLFVMFRGRSFIKESNIEAVSDCFTMEVDQGVYHLW